MVPLDKILPSRKVPVGLATSRKYKQIRASIEEVGLIEPLSVAAMDAASGQHLLLDGHVRLGCAARSGPPGRAVPDRHR